MGSFYYSEIATEISIFPISPVPLLPPPDPPFFFFCGCQIALHVLLISYAPPLVNGIMSGASIHGTCTVEASSGMQCSYVHKWILSREYYPHTSDRPHINFYS